MVQRYLLVLKPECKKYDLGYYQESLFTYIENFKKDKLFFNFSNNTMELYIRLDLDTSFIFEFQPEEKQYYDTLYSILIPPVNVDPRLKYATVNGENISKYL